MDEVNIALFVFNRSPNRIVLGIERFHIVGQFIIIVRTNSVSNVMRQGNVLTFKVIGVVPLPEVTY